MVVQRVETTAEMMGEWPVDWMDACSTYQKGMMLVETTVYYSAVEKALYLARLKEHSKVEMKARQRVEL